MPHAIVFYYFESGTQASDTLSMSQFHKTSTVWHNVVTRNPHKSIKLSRFRWTKYLKSLIRI